MALNKLETSLYYNNSLHIYYIQIGSILFLFPFLFPQTFKWFDNLTNTLNNNMQFQHANFNNFSKCSFFSFAPFQDPQKCVKAC